MIRRLAAFLALALADGAASLAAAGVLTWAAQREFWGFDASDPEHWRYLDRAWQGPGISLDFAASFPAAIALWAALWWGMARAFRVARSAMPRDRRRASARPAPASWGGTSPEALRDWGLPVPSPDPTAVPEGAPDRVACAPGAPDALDELTAQTPAARTEDEGHALAVNAARERGFYAYPNPSGAPGFAVAGLAAGRILLIASFDAPGSWMADPGTCGAWFDEDGAEAPCPAAAAEAALAAFEAEHATALEGFEVYLVEAAVLVTAATIDDAEALAGLVDRGDGLPRLDETIQRADQALAVREDLAGYVRRKIA